MSIDLEKIRMKAYALEKLRKLELVEAFDAFSPTSRPNPTQEEYLKDINKYKIRLIRAGGQCLAKGTLVATPKGPRPIEEIEVGDIVYGRDGLGTKVTATHTNGIKEVFPLLTNAHVIAYATSNHSFLTKNRKKSQEKTVAEMLGKVTRIERNIVRAPLGDVLEERAYLLGAMLGDGCCTRGSHLYLSTLDEEVVQKCANILGVSYRPEEGSNTWRIDSKEGGDLYDSWCKGKKAHEKGVDLSIIKTWARPSLLQFLAGLMDTDGSIFTEAKGPVFNLWMQSLSTIEAAQYAILALWGIKVEIEIDSREGKYVNGPCYYIRIRGTWKIHAIMEELHHYLIKRKQLHISKTRDNKEFYTVKIGEPFLAETFDITVDRPDSLYLLADGSITHNSGKTQCLSKEYAWILTDTHPYWEKPASWGNEPYLMLIAGQDRKMMEAEIWGKKLKPFLEAVDGEGAWREVRSGNTLQYVYHRKKNYKILFLSHSDSSESNRKHMQGYVAHFVWMDELANNISIIEELQRRIQAKDGWFSLTFSPKGKSEAIRKWADGLTPPYGKVYRMGMLDNPIYADRKDEIKRRLDNMPEGMRNAVLYGDWEVGDQSVYQFSWDMVSKPDNYNAKTWRHVEALDPAMSGKSGLLILAEDPTTTIWYAVKEEYVEGLFSPDELVEYIKKITAPYNIVRRVVDPHESWYVRMASKLGLSYIAPYKKNERKDELVKGLQLHLSQGKLKVAPWLENFIDELQTAQWKEGDGAPKIVNRKNLHLQDAAQYAIDCLPKAEMEMSDKKWWEILREENNKRKKREKLRVRNKGKWLIGPSGTRRL
jgi:hypothetical protein